MILKKKTKQRNWRVVGRRFISIFLIGVSLPFACLSSFCNDNVNTPIIDLKIIAFIESSNNPMAFNAKSGARGLYQITPICLQEWNNYHPDSKFNLQDLYNPLVSEGIAEWYLQKRIPQMLKHYGIPVKVDSILWGYNAGIGNVVKGVKPQETVDYIRKYNNLTKGGRR